jgi:hypothetical protein
LTSKASDRPVRRLLALQGPLHFVAGYLALSYCARHEGEGSESETVLLMYDFLAPEEVEGEFVDVISELSKVATWRSVVFVSGREMKRMVSGRYDRCTARLRCRLGTDVFDEIFIARDFCGEGSSLILNAYPDARRITYGDSLGLVGNEEVLDDSTTPRTIRFLLAKARLQLLHTLWGRPRRFRFDAAVLTLPIDWSGMYLKDLPVIVPSKMHVLQVIEALAQRSNALQAYCRCLLDQAGTLTPYLFLLSNLAASRVLAHEAEVRLYVSLISEIAPDGAAVLIKPHPRGDNTVLEEVLQRLSGKYRVIPITDRRLSRYPIELWQELIRNCHITAMFSTSAINLKYFYDCEVKCPLNDEIITGFIPSHNTEYMKTATRVIGEAIAALDTWDGRSVLWRG